ncbi:hypothetical protein ACFO3O_06340 [Dokdonia ponticola]|uniref:Chromosomal replication initiator DnaA C-terminal domain-containing protein n=1 Tax=Dokdonia ponticola TaxID=2041041 RepID=A0ABV9HTP6_9FLAO
MNEQKDILEKNLTIYGLLDVRVQQLVSKFGITRAIAMLDGMTSPQIVLDDAEKEVLIVNFLNKRAQKYFGFTAKDFYNAQDQNARDARMSCYYLLVKHVGMNYQTIAYYYKQKRRNIRYNYKKIEEIIEIKTFYKDFFKRFDALESSLITYLLELKTK